MSRSAIEERGARSDTARLLTGLARAVPPDQRIAAPGLEAQLRVGQDLGALGGGLALALGLSGRVGGGCRGDGDVEAFDIEL